MKEKQFLNNIHQWLNAIRQGLLYAFAASSRLGLNTFMPEHDSPRFAAVFDNNPALWGAAHQGLLVLPPEKARALGGKILVFTADYHRTRLQLLAMGLHEFTDFMYINDFLTLYHWHCHQKVFINSIHTAVTTRCTLRCEHCNMFIPRHTNAGHIPLKTLIDDCEKLFSAADYVQFFGVLGGEPFLHPEFATYLKRLATYRERVAAIEITTNGTLIPPQKVLEACRAADISVRVSDYSANAGAKYPALRQRLLDVLRAEGVRHTNVPPASWNHFFVPNGGLLQSLDNEALTRHFHRCSPMFKGLNNGRFYHCHLSWSAARCAVLTEGDGDFLELSPAARPELVRRTLGHCPTGFPALCRQCYGCDPEYQFPIEAGPQKDEVV